MAIAAYLSIISLNGKYTRMGHQRRITPEAETSGNIGSRKWRS